MRVLLVVHGYPPAANGGTEVYTRNLAHALDAIPGTEVAVLAREADPSRPDLALRRARDGSLPLFGINNTFSATATLEDSYANPALLEVAAQVLDDVRPDVVHIQHLTCLSTGIPKAAARRGIPVVFTLNDYWLLCHRGQLFDLDHRRCDGPFDGGCARCIPRSSLAAGRLARGGRLVRGLGHPGAAAAALAARAVDRIRSDGAARAASRRRLEHMREAMHHVDRLLAPSQTIADRFLRWGIEPARLVRCAQGIPLAPYGAHRRAPAATLRIGFAGGFLPSKAPHLLLDAVERLPAGAVTVDLLGSAASYHGRSDYADAVLRRLPHPAVRRHGPVPHDHMPAALHEVDVVAVPSVWLENAPFIIREAFAAGAPVVASRLGGMAEMVRHEGDGLLVTPGDAADLAAALGRLLDEPGLLDRLRAGIRAPMSIEADAAALRAQYGSLLPGKRPVVVPASPVRTPRVTAVVLNFRTPGQTWLAVRSLQASFVPPTRIIVVDNGSNDGSEAVLRASLPGAEILASAENLGFPGGCNLGIRAALEQGADYVLLVNSDAVLAPDAVGRLIARMEEDAAAGIAAPLLLSREEPGVVASAGIRYSRRTGRMRQLGAGLPVGRVASLEAGADAVSGCVMMIRREVLERIGLLDEAYFFSFEDIDFCLRAADAGYRPVCVAGAVAYHEGGRTIGRRSARRVYFATRNHLRLQARTGAARGRRLREASVLALNAAWVVTSREVSLVPGLLAVLRGAGDYLRGRVGGD